MINQNSLNLDIKDPQQIKILRISNLERENHTLFRRASFFLLIKLILISFLLISDKTKDSLVYFLAFIVPLAGVLLLYAIKYYINSKKINYLEEKING